MKKVKHVHPVPSFGSVILISRQPQSVWLRTHESLQDSGCSQQACQQGNKANSGLQQLVYKKGIPTEFKKEKTRVTETVP